MRKEKNNHGSIDFDKYISEKDGTGVCAIGDKRLIIKGKPKISICKNQDKFGDELEISLIAHKDKKVEKEARNNSKWNVIDIYFPLEEGKEIIKALYEQLFTDKIQNTTKFIEEKQSTL